MTDENLKFQTATFAGGCFWCIESDFKKFPGVRIAISGYTGGYKGSPTYHEVSSGRSGHWEAVQIKFDPNAISYENLLDIFWRHIDPTDAGGQFVDRGSQYRTAIFYHDEHQMRLADMSKQRLSGSMRFKRPIVTDILPATAFYPAEAYHQGYYIQNPLRYKFYRRNSGRDQFLQEVWDSADTQAAALHAQKPIGRV